MFKKEPRVKALSNLKNSERKKLQTRIQTQFNDPEFKFQSNVIKQTNFVSTVTQGTIYTNDDGNIPIFFKEKHNETIYPTVYTCWLYPRLIPTVLTHHIVLQDHIFNGANLMISGTVPPFDSRLQKNVFCGIVDKISPNVILAIGVVEMADLTQYNDTGVLGQSGVAVRVIHHLEDGLFKEFKVKLDIPNSMQLESHDNTNTTQNDEELNNATSFATNDMQATVGENSSNHSVHVKEAAEVLEKLSIENVDHFMTRALYYTIKQDQTLNTPITASTFISNHIMKNLPPTLNHEEVNVKKSSWKKTAKYLKHFEKEGILKLKGKGDDLIIIQVNKEKDEIKNFVPYKISSQGSNNNKNNNCENNKVNKNGNSDSDNSKGLTVETLYKPTSEMKTFLTQQLTSICSEKKDNLPNLVKTEYYTVSTIKEVIDYYIKKQSLVNQKDPKTILLDDILFKMANKSVKSPKFDRIIPRSQIVNAIVNNNFTEYYKIFDKSGTPLSKTPKRGSIPHINIVTEMKIGRKIITRLNNFEVYNIDSEQIASDLRKLCSGSTTISETPQFGSEVQIQGPHGSTIIQYLNDKVGIPNKWIDFENKLKNKNRKK